MTTRKPWRIGTKGNQVIEGDWPRSGRLIAAFDSVEDACLVAAAPDLLSACVLLADAWDRHDVEAVPGWSDAASAVRAAIAKASGG